MQLPWIILAGPERGDRAGQKGASPARQGDDPLGRRTERRRKAHLAARWGEKLSKNTIRSKMCVEESELSPTGEEADEPMEVVYERSHG